MKQQQQEEEESKVRPRPAAARRPDARVASKRVKKITMIEQFRIDDAKNLAANAEDGSDSGASGLCSGRGHLPTGVPHASPGQVTPASVRSAAVPRSSPRLHTDAAVKLVLESMGGAAEVADEAGASDAAGAEGG